ncbi:MAG: mandelate racemase/muconate lactonizing enzyme family protein [Candidatus Latescibacterota bacterium]|nr:mandelate racemase/muconate lactonizing enzyme family protein [Candidatus Latescibacterota bacterium]
MKIISVDIWTVVVPTIPGRVHSPEWVSETGWDQVPKHILRLNTDTELVGVGETYRGVSLEETQQGAAQLLGEDPEALCLRDVFSHRHRLEGDERGVPATADGPAYDAVEMALLDLVGKARELPAHGLFGGALRDRVRADYWIGHQTPEDGKRSVARALEHGFNGVKIKCRLEEPMKERLQAMRDVAGPNFKVTVDPNERFYSAEQAIDLALQLEAIGNVEVFEDPFDKRDVEGWIRFHEAVESPVAMHLANGAQMLTALKAGCVDCFNLGGGPVKFSNLSVIAEADGMPCWHGSGNDLGIVDTYFIHASSLAAGCTMASDFVGSWTREDDLIIDPIEFADGFVATPQRPGLGCDLDLSALDRYATSHDLLNAH